MVLRRDGVVVEIRWVEEGGGVPGDAVARLDREGDVCTRVVREFAEYWEGRRTSFSFPYAPLRGSVFERVVWGVLKTIPYGETWSYQRVAVEAGVGALAARAVGRACARNPLPLVVPCHRVVGKDGSLGGYSAPGGTRLKAQLIAFERGHAGTVGSTVAERSSSTGPLRSDVGEER